MKPKNHKIRYNCEQVLNIELSIEKSSFYGIFRFAKLFSMVCSAAFLTITFRKPVRDVQTCFCEERIKTNRFLPIDYSLLKYIATQGNSRTDQEGNTVAWTPTAPRWRRLTAAVKALPRSEWPFSFYVFSTFSSVSFLFSCGSFPFPLIFHCFKQSEKKRKAPGGPGSVSSWVHRKWAGLAELKHAVEHGTETLTNNGGNNKQK